MVTTVAAKIAFELAGLRYREAQINQQFSYCPTGNAYSELSASRDIIRKEIEGWEILYQVATGDLLTVAKPEPDQRHPERRLAESAGLVPRTRADGMPTPQTWETLQAARETAQQHNG